MANVLLFAPLAVVLDTGLIEIELNEQTQTIHDLNYRVIRKRPGMAAKSEPGKLQITLNRPFAVANSNIKNSDEITFILCWGRLVPNIMAEYQPFPCLVA